MPTELEQAVLDATLRGDVEALKELHAGGVDIRRLHDDGRTLLHVAMSRKGNGHLVEYLIDQGVDVNARVDMELALVPGDTALLMAVEQNDLEACRALLRRGARADDPAVGEKSWRSPLSLAVLKSVEIARLLLPISSHASRGQALGVCARNIDSASPARALIVDIIRAGTSPYVQSTFEPGSGIGLLHWVLQNGSVEAVGEFLKVEEMSLDVTMRPVANAAEMLPIHAAASLRHERYPKVIIDRSLAQGIDVNALDSFGETALSIAVAAENEDVCAYLIAQGARPRPTILHQKQSGTFFSELAMAARSRNAGICRMIAPIFTEAQLQEELAAALGDLISSARFIDRALTETVSVLLELGADPRSLCVIDESSGERISALQHAEQDGFSEIHAMMTACLARERLSQVMEQAAAGINPKPGK